MRRLLIIGCGNVISRALPWLTQRFRVYATARNEAQSRSLRAAGVTPIRADLDHAPSLKRLAGIADLVLHSAPPATTGQYDIRTRRLIAALSSANCNLPHKLIYISTSGVYGDCNGELVSETHPVHPQTDRARRRCDAEYNLRNWGRRSGISIVCLRAPGIYAKDRLPLARLLQQLPVLHQHEDVYTNHIHAEDLAKIAGLGLFRGRAGRLYNASDNTHLMMGDYYDLMADEFGLPRPPRASRLELSNKLSASTLSFMAESRRLENRRLLEELRITLRYPEVHTGLRAAKIDFVQTTLTTAV